jgi:two-component system sensor histidine kinase ComP
MVQWLGWFIAFATLFSRNPASIHLFILFSLLALPFLSVGASSRAEPLGMFLMGLSVNLFFYSFIHFINQYFRVHLQMNIRPLHPILIYSVPGAAMILELNFLFLHAPSMISLIRNINLLVMLIGFIAAATYLFRLYLKSRTNNPAAKNALSIIFFGLSGSFAPLILLYLVPFLLFQVELFSVYVLLWFIIILPLTFMYLILAQRLIDIGIFVQRLFFSLSLALIPGFISFIILYLLFGGQLTAIQLTRFTLLTFGLFSIFLYLLEYATDWMEQILFSHKTRIRNELKRIFQTLATVKNLRELRDEVLIEVKALFQVKGLLLSIENMRGNSEVLLGDLDRTSQLNVAFQLLDHSDFRATLYFATKQNNTAFSREELRAIRLLVEYLATTLVNIYLLERLSERLNELLIGIESQEHPEALWFKQSVFLLLEKERERMANDLHDTTMQDVLMLKQKLHIWIEQNKTIDVDVIKDSVEHLEMVNVSLREICFSLYPNTLKVLGFTKSIDQLIKSEQIRVPYRIEWLIQGEVELENIDLETKTHLFRVIQELLHNARKYSHANLVKINVSYDSGNVQLDYQDDGVGFDADVVLYRREFDHGSGWLQIKNRVLQMKGDLQLVSQTNEGLQVTIKFTKANG